MYRTELESRIKKYQREHSITNLSLSHMLNIGESTLYARWRNPSSFSEGNLSVFAKLLGETEETISELISRPAFSEKQEIIERKRDDFTGDDKKEFLGQKIYLAFFIGLSVGSCISIAMSYFTVKMALSIL